MIEGHPEIDARAFKTYLDALDSRPDDTARIERLLRFVGRIINVDSVSNVLVLGCGPRPQVFRILASRGFRVVGVDPVPSFVEEARRYVGDKGTVLVGAAESIPLPDCSQ